MPILAPRDVKVAKPSHGRANASKNIFKHECNPVSLYRYTETELFIILLLHSGN